MSRVQTVQAIEACGVVAVIRLREPEKLRAVVDALGEGGVRALEVTMTVPGAIDLIGQMAPTLPKGFVLGAGTILDAETARLAILAGAQFVVGPVFKPAARSRRRCMIGSRTSACVPVRNTRPRSRSYLSSSVARARGKSTAGRRRRCRRSRGAA